MPGLPVRFVTIAIRYRKRRFCSGVVYTEGGLDGSVFSLVHLKAHQSDRGLPQET